MGTEGRDLKTQLGQTRMKSSSLDTQDDLRQRKRLDLKGNIARIVDVFFTEEEEKQTVLWTNILISVRSFIAEVNFRHIRNSNT